MGIRAVKSRSRNSLVDVMFYFECGMREIEVNTSRVWSAEGVELEWLEWKQAQTAEDKDLAL